MEEIRQYLTFRIAGEEYALCVSNVREILEVPRVTRIPRMPDFMAGVINLRGSVVPLVDLKLKLGLGATDVSTETAIVVVEVPHDGDNEQKTRTIGIYADAVHKVITIERESVEPTPTIGLSIDSSFIEGMAKQDDGFITILAVNGIITAKEIESAQAEADKPADVSQSAVSMSAEN